MSRKHFVAIAEAIRQNIQNKQQREELARALVPALKEANRNFDTYRFIAATVGD